jgi:alpha-beta hydrolase superfamily lysophospholipase
VRDAPVNTVVSMGGLVTWVKVPRMLRAAFSWPWLVERVKLKDTRKFALKALPALARFAPKLLSMYLNTESTDTTQAELMTQTVEDPNPFVNAEIAQWMKRRELHVRGVNVSDQLSRMKHPFLCVVANHDGIVPPATSRAICSAIGSSHKELLEVGDSRAPIAHADLFLSTGAQDRIFSKVADFLIRHT